MKAALLALAVAVALTSPALPKGSGVRTGTSSSSRSYRRGPRSQPRSQRPSRCSLCARDGHGKIARNPATKLEFERANPCPSTGKTSGACPGYIVDHVTPLKRGGADDPSNMQWQTKEAAKARDRTE